ncbi:MAG: UDP-N-acetylmuramoyl-L-alanine--D-glutamate ligase [Pseudomonadota bacterium]
MTAAMLTAAGVPATAAGNIGTPVLDLLDEPVPGAYVVELSSFQLDRSDTVPARAAALLNISEDHLDWHGSVEAYRRAKLRILERAAVAVVPHALAGAVPDGPARVIRFGLDAPAAGDFGIVREDGRDWFSAGKRRLLAVDAAFSPAPHNQLNALAALALVDAFGADTAAAAQALTCFEPLPHRGARVRVLDGVTYVDDSKATNVGAALASIRAVAGPVVLVAGGDAKGADLTPLAAALSGRVRAVVALGAAAGALDDALHGTAPVERADDMNDAVARARRRASSGDTVLLAPACASTDMFANYRERGEAFVRAVAGLGS